MVCTGATAFPLPGTCTDGHLCYNGLETPCSPGYRCPSGALTMLKCEDGTYQDQPAQQTCITCTEGNYCMESLFDTDEQTIIARSTDVSGTHPYSGTITPVACPEGYFCNAGTGDYRIYPCPIGTFRESTGAKNSGECTDCTDTSYCP